MTMVKVVLALISLLSCQLIAAPNFMVKVRTFSQAIDERSPWAQKPITESQYVGVALSKNTVLISTQAVKDLRYIEVETLSSSKRYPAELSRVDYNAQLAIIKVNESLAAVEPVKLGQDLKLNSKAKILSLKQKKVVPINTSFRDIKVRGSLTASYNLPHYTFEVKRKGVGWSEPVVKEDLLVGLSIRKEKNQILALPVSVIRRFLKGKGELSSFGKLGLKYHKLHDRLLRQELGLKGEEYGVWLSDVTTLSPLYKKARPGDVLLSIEDYKLKSNGRVYDKRWGDIPLSGVVYRFPVGSKLKAKVFRSAKVVDIDFTMKVYDGSADMIPFYSDSQRHFTIYNGFVLQELSRNYLQSWGRSWLSRAPTTLMKRIAFENNPPADMPQKKVVILSKVLVDQSNKGYEGLKNLEFDEINGKKVENIKQVYGLLKSPIIKDGRQYTKLNFGPIPREVILDHSKVDEANERIAKLYSVQAQHLWRTP